MDVQSAAYGHDLDSIGFSGFKLFDNYNEVMKMLGHYAGSHWKDEWLETQFYLKGYGWTSDDPTEIAAAKSYFNTDKAIVEASWLYLKNDSTFKINSNFEACVDQVLENWTWDNFTTILKSDDYNWGLTHGDFHAGQVMINDDDWTDLALLDWEMSGFSNPAIDLSSWMSIVFPFILRRREDEWLISYYQGLAEEIGEEAADAYPFETLKADYLSYGVANAIVRWVGLMGLAAQ